MEFLPGQITWEINVLYESRLKWTWHHSKFAVEEVSFFRWLRVVLLQLYINTWWSSQHDLMMDLGVIRSRPKLNYGTGRDFGGLSPNLEPRGNNRSFPETRERACVPVKKIGSHDSIFGLVNSTYFFKITNHNQHAFNIKYLANLIKKYWTCFHYQKLADFLVCFPPSIRVAAILENLLEDPT